MEKYAQEELDCLMAIDKHGSLTRPEIYKMFREMGIAIPVKMFDELNHHEKCYLQYSLPGEYVSNTGTAEYLAKRYEVCRFMLSKAGIRYLKLLLSEKAKEEMDYKLKKVQYWPARYWYIVSVISGAIGAFITKLLS